MAKLGSEFQNLVAAIEKAAASDPTISIKSPEFLTDKDTGEKREHDVVVIYERGHHRLVTAIECRDRSRKVGVPEIEAFKKKCEATGVHRGIIVSSLGFYSTAIQKANQLDIGCMTMTSAEQFNWCLMSHMTVTGRRVDHIDVYVQTATPPAPGAILIVEGDASFEIDKDTLFKVGRHFFENSPDIAAYGVGKHKHRLLHHDPQLVARDPDGTEHRAVEVRYTYDFEVTETLSSAKFQTYQDPVSGETSAQVASFDIPMQDVVTKLLLVRDPSEVTQVMTLAKSPRLYCPSTSPKAECCRASSRGFLVSCS